MQHSKQSNPEAHSDADTEPGVAPGQGAGSGRDSLADQTYVQQSVGDRRIEESDPSTTESGSAAAVDVNAKPIKSNGSTARD